MKLLNATSIRLASTSKIASLLLYVLSSWVSKEKNQLSLPAILSGDHHEVSSQSFLLALMVSSQPNILQVVVDDNSGF